MVPEFVQPRQSAGFQLIPARIPAAGFGPAHTGRRLLPYFDFQVFLPLYSKTAGPRREIEPLVQFLWL